MKPTRRKPKSPIISKAKNSPGRGRGACHAKVGAGIAEQHKLARKTLMRSRLKFGVAFLGSARTKPGQVYYDKNIEAAAAVAALGYPIIHGGGPGQMEASAKGAQIAGGQSVGLGLHLGRKETVTVTHDVSIWFNDFSPRIDTFRHLSRVAMVFFPGGIGSLHEAMSVIDHIMQKKAPVRPIIFFEPDSENPFWQGFFQWLQDTVMTKGLLKAEEIHFVKIARSVDELVGFVQQADKKTN